MACPRLPPSWRRGTRPAADGGNLSNRTGRPRVSLGHGDTALTTPQLAGSSDSRPLRACRRVRIGPLVWGDTGRAVRRRLGPTSFQGRRPPFGIWRKSGTPPTSIATRPSLRLRSELRARCGHRRRTLPVDTIHQHCSQHCSIPCTRVGVRRPTAPVFSCLVITSHSVNRAVSASAGRSAYWGGLRSGRRFPPRESADRRRLCRKFRRTFSLSEMQRSRSRGAAAVNYRVAAWFCADVRRLTGC